MTQVRPAVLHVCPREHLLHLRDHALQAAGYLVDSVPNTKLALVRAMARPYQLVLVDIESDTQVKAAERFCDDVRKILPEAIIGFVCNWQVSRTSQCPDDVIHAEFNPDAFVSGVRQMLKPS